MTNKPMLSVELRALLERVVKGAPGSTWAALDDDRLAATEELRALLDKPVGRQPEFKKVEMAHVFSALDDVRGKPTLTSNQCHDLAQALNDRLLAPLQLLELPQKYASAAQHRGEPVACMPIERCYDVRAKMIIAFNEAKKAGGDLDDALDAAYKSALRYSPNPMSAEQPAPVAVVMPERKTKADYSGYIEQFQSEAAGLYNSALDDVARLNGVKP